MIRTFERACEPAQMLGEPSLWTYLWRCRKTEDLVRIGGPDEEPVVMPFGYIESFSPEFRTLGVGTRVLDQIRQIENAKVYSVGDSPAKATFAPGSSVERVPAWPILLVVSILLCPLDILARRLG